MKLQDEIIKDLIEIAELKTYDDWNISGYYINKGEKAVLFYDDKVYFQKEQVTKKKKQNYDIYLGGESYMDEFGIYEYNPDASWIDDEKIYTEWFIPNTY